MPFGFDPKFLKGICRWGFYVVLLAGAYMFKIGIAGIIITVLLGYLRHDFVKRWIRNALNLESNWWIDAVSFLLIAVAGLVTFYVLNQTQNAREIAEEKVVTLEERTVALNPYRQNITDFSATVSIVVKSNGE